MSGGKISDDVLRMLCDVAMEHPEERMPADIVQAMAARLRELLPQAPVVRQRGRRKESDGADVDRLVRMGGISAARACRLVARMNDKKLETVQQAYRRFKKQQRQQSGQK